MKNEREREREHAGCYQSAFLARGTVNMHMVERCVEDSCTSTALKKLSSNQCSMFSLKLSHPVIPNPTAERQQGEGGGCFPWHDKEGKGKD